MAATRRRAAHRLLILPLLGDHIESPGVGNELVQLIATEENDLLVHRGVDQPRIGPLRRLLVEFELSPGVGGRSIGPGAGVAALALDQRKHF